MTVNVILPWPPKELSPVGSVRAVEQGEPV